MPQTLMVTAIEFYEAQEQQNRPNQADQNEKQQQQNAYTSVSVRPFFHCLLSNSSAIWRQRINTGIN